MVVATYRCRSRFPNLILNPSLGIKEGLMYVDDNQKLSLKPRLHLLLFPVKGDVTFQRTVVAYTLMTHFAFFVLEIFISSRSCRVACNENNGVLWTGYSKEKEISPIYFSRV